MKTAVKQGDFIHCTIRLPSGKLHSEVQKIKRIARFDPKARAWILTFTPESIAALKKLHYSFEGELGDIVNPRKQVIRPPEPQAPVDLSKLPSTLRPYQLEAIRFLEATDWRGMVALTPRLGKSVVSLAGKMLHDFTPIVILTTASGKPVWEREIEKWLNCSSYIISGTTPYCLPNAHCYIVNYDIVDAWVDELLAKSPELLIVDECHRISNPFGYVPKSKEEYEADLALAKTLNRPIESVKKGKKVPIKCTYAFLTLAREIPHVVPLSGTPATTCPAQMQVPLSVLDSEHFGNRDKFLYRYCAPKKGYRGWLFEGLSHEDELIPLLSRVMFRRTKEEVFQDLPDEQHEFLPFTIDYDLYTKELAELKAWYEQHKNVSDDELDQKISQFESLSYSKKRTQIIEWVNDYLESGKKLVIFTWHRVASEDLYHVFKKKAVLIYGNTDPSKREAIIDQFNTDPNTQIFIGQITSCSEAISLYGADTVLYAELPDTPKALQQSSERIWLPSIKRDKMFYYYAVAAKTLDEKRIETLRDRAKLLGILYGDDPKASKVFENKIRTALDNL